MPCIYKLLYFYYCAVVAINMENCLVSCTVCIKDLNYVIGSNDITFTRVLLNLVTF